MPSCAKSSGTAAGRNAAQSFSASSSIGLPNGAAIMLERVIARAPNSRAIVSPRACASEITCRRIALPDMPAA
jgi:hypothetical protein